jgi:hypothetical protein
MRKAIADSDGKCAGYEYITEIIEIKLTNESDECEPEIIGGEYIIDEDK